MQAQEAALSALADSQVNPTVASTILRLGTDRHADVMTILSLAEAHMPTVQITT